MTLLHPRVCSPYTRLVPKVSNLSARGTLRLGLTRLVPQLPGFGALLVSLAREPQVGQWYGCLVLYYQANKMACFAQCAIAPGAATARV